jgi:hypothetical protein
MGRDKTERVIRELIDARYVIRGGQRRTKSQQWGPADYVILDHPAEMVAAADAGEAVGDTSVVLSAEVDADRRRARPASGQAEPIEPVSDTSVVLDHRAEVAPRATPSTSVPPCPEKPHAGEPHAGNQGTYKELNLQKAADDARAREPAKSLITSEALKLAEVLMRLQHLDPDDPRSVGAAYTAQTWLAKGWRPELIQQTVEIVMARRGSAPKSLRYFEGAIAEAHAEQDRPLPVANITNPKNSEGGVRYASNRGPGGFARLAIAFARRNAVWHPSSL